MKKQTLILLFFLMALTGCSKSSGNNTTEYASKTEIPTEAETTTEKKETEKTKEELPTEEQLQDEYEKSESSTEATSSTSETTVADVQTDVLSEQQAINAIERYCRIKNPDLDTMSQTEYNFYWEIVESTDTYYNVLFRSYTGAQQHFYIDRNSGKVTVSEFVPGITIEETPTDETFNIYDYVG